MRHSWRWRLGLTLLLCALRSGAAAVSIDLEGGSAAPGAALTVTAHLDAGGVAVAAVQNRLPFAAPLRVAARPDGRPDCAVNPGIDKPASAFRFVPQGCDPAASCAAVTAVVIAFDNLDPIPDGAALYSCRIAVAADAAPGSYRLDLTEAAAAGPDGALLAAEANGAAIDVVAAPPPLAIAVATRRAAAGDRVAVPVTLSILDAAGAGVAGTLNDVQFEPEAPIAVTGAGAPDCAVDPAIDKHASAFIFLPPGCAPGVDCTGVRAVVLALDNVDPIPDGATLYRCTVAVAAAAGHGSYALRNGNATGGTAAGVELPALAADGAVEVVCPGDCDGDQRVAISELLRGVNMSLSSMPLAACPVLDTDVDGEVAINEIVRAVASALDGCAPSA